MCFQLATRPKFTIRRVQQKHYTDLSIDAGTLKTGSNDVLLKRQKASPERGAPIPTCA